MKPPGHDYNSLIHRAVDALRVNVRDTRLMLYEQARRAQRTSFDPEIPEAEFGRERTALEKAIRKSRLKPQPPMKGRPRVTARSYPTMCALWWRPRRDWIASTM